jgi:ribonuclease HI
MTEEARQVHIYTDGACDPNPGPGGWGAVLVYGPQTKEISGAEPHTTNNRMELTAAIEALRLLKRPCNVVLHTDSQYLRRGITEWLPVWQAKGWRKADGKPVENVELWQELLRQAQRHHITWEWIRGHRGDPLNERADRLAKNARATLPLETRIKRPKGHGSRAD